MNKKVQIKINKQKNILFFNFIVFFFFFSFVNCISVCAEAKDCLSIYEKLQTEKITLNIKNKPLKYILAQIEKISGIGYVIKSEIKTETLNTLSINVKDVTIESALNTLLANTDCTYEVFNNIITIKNKAKRIPAGKSDEKLVVQGRVADKAGKPIVGATIIIKGTSDGAISDENGKFKLGNVAVGATIEVTFLGMKPQMMTITENLPNVVLTMEEDAMAVEDVVVNGIFERKAGTFSGAVTTFNNDDLKRVSNSNALQALKNLDPSIMFYDNMEYGSDPNRLPEMSIRGKSSLNLKDNNLRTFENDPNAPLFVLDGFEVSMQKVMDIDMNRIESMTILKDATAKAIYGSKAANGVIVIELKKNATGELRVTYNGSMEIQAPDLTSYDLTNAYEKLDVERASGMYEPSTHSFENLRALNQLYNQKLTFVTSGINTDWISKPLRVGVGTKHGVSVDLGSETLKAIVDLSYNNVKGTMRNSDRTTISGGITLSYRHKKFLFKDQLIITSNTSNDSNYGSFDEYTKLNPYYTPYDANGNLSTNIIPQLSNIENGEIVNLWYGNINFEANPLYNANLNTLLQEKYIDITNNFDLQWLVNNSLKMTLRFGLNEKRNKLDNFYPANHLKFSNYSGENFFRKGSYLLINGQESNVSGKFDLQYNKELFPKNNIYFNAGFELSQRKLSTNETSAEGFPSDMMNDIMFARQYVEGTKPTGREQTTREIGYYLSLNYSYDNRFNMDATFRQSASSMYGADSRWGAFWSTGVSWNLHKEKWLASSIISRLRIRASIGSTGSQSSSAYNAIASYRYFLDRTYDGFLAAELISMKNEDLQWQNKMDKNIGLDLSIKNSFSITFDYYNAQTNNAVNPLSLVPSTGFTTVQENIGKVKNKGMDLKVKYTVWQKPSERSSLTFSVGVSRNKNTLVEISDAMKSYNNEQNAASAKSSKPVNKFYDGMSMDAIWAMPSLGIDPANGNEIFLAKDDKGGPYRTYVYNPTYQVVCGDRLPKLSGNASVNFAYKGFGINCTFRYQYGAQMYNSTLINKVENANLNYNVDRRIYTDRWRNPGDVVMYKRIDTKNVSATKKNALISSQTMPTSRFVQDRNEFSISSCQISYDFFRHDFMKKIGLERMRFSVNANDLLMLSSIEIERGTSYPFARTFNASLSLTF